MLISNYAMINKNHYTGFWKMENTMVDKLCWNIIYLIHVNPKLI